MYLQHNIAALRRACPRGVGRCIRARHRSAGKRCGEQIERAMTRGLSEKDARARLERQMPIEEKRRFADYIIDTSGTPESTVEQTRVVYTSLRSLTQ